MASRLSDQQQSLQQSSAPGTRSRTSGQAVVALRPDQLEVFNSLRVIEGRVAVAAKFGNPLFGVRGLGRLQNFFDLLFANLRVNDVKGPGLAHEFLVIFHGAVNDIDYAK